MQWLSQGDLPNNALVTLPISFSTTSINIVVSNDRGRGVVTTSCALYSKSQIQFFANNSGNSTSVTFICVGK